MGKLKLTTEMGMPVNYEHLKYHDFANSVKKFLEDNNEFNTTDLFRFMVQEVSSAVSSRDIADRIVTHKKEIK